MTVAISNVALTNTFDFQRTVINQLAYAMSTYAVTTNANVATGNAIVNGYLTANGLVANSLTINGGTGVVSVGNVSAAFINVANVTTTVNITSTGTATLNVASISTATGNLFTVNTGSFGNLTVTGTSTLNVVSITTLNALTLANATTGWIVNLNSNVVNVNTSIKVGNTTANITITAPNTVQQGGTYYLNGNGSWVVVTGGSANVGGSNTQIQFNDSGSLNATSGFTFNKASNALFVGNTVTSNIHIAGNNQWQQVYVTTSGTGSQVIDSWLLANFGAAEYKLLMYQVNTVNALATSLMVVTGANSGSIAMIEHGLANTGALIGTFAVTTNTTHAILSVTPTVTPTTINLQRTLLSI